MLAHWSALHPSSSSSSSSSTCSHLSTSSSLSSTFSDLSSFSDPAPSSPRTHAFFASPFSLSPAAPPAPLPPPSKSTTRSLTADFFNSPPPSARPTPPPSIHARSPTSSPPASPAPSLSSPRHAHIGTRTRPGTNDSNTTVTSAKTNKLPPLARFFPSRYNSDPTHDLPLPDAPPFDRPKRRAFCDLDLDLKLDATPNPSSGWDGYYADNTVFVAEPVSSPVSPTSTSTDPDPLPHTHKLKPGTILTSPFSTTLRPTTTSTPTGASLELELVRPLGHGAFSSVWLARAGSSPPSFASSISPPRYSMAGQSDEGGVQGRLVAVKLALPVEIGGGEEARIARMTFEREGEILRHISHPNIIPLLASRTLSLPPLSPPFLPTPAPLTIPALLLPHIQGTDLLDLVNSDMRHATLGAGVLRRVVRELAGVLGWLHSVGVVHRDVKLENILLTTPDPTMDTPSPLIKLTDFGLARAVRVGRDTEEVELLSTRCGSEAYAAPELVVGGHGRGHRRRARGIGGPHHKHFRGAGFGFEYPGEDGVDRTGETEGGEEGWYDGRATDAWAVGVVVYALVCRALPFGEGVPALKAASAGGEWEGDGFGRERRSWLMQIARGEYGWPEDGAGFDHYMGSSEPTTSASLHPTNQGRNQEPHGAQLAHVQGVRKLVGKLLVRDPRGRAKLADLLGWGGGGGDEWLMAEQGTGERAQGRVEGVFGDVAWCEVK